MSCSRTSSIVQMDGKHESGFKIFKINDWNSRPSAASLKEKHFKLEHYCWYKKNQIDPDVSIIGQSMYVIRFFTPSYKSNPHFSMHYNHLFHSHVLWMIYNCVISDTIWAAIAVQRWWSWWWVVFMHKHEKGGFSLCIMRKCSRRHSFTCFHRLHVPITQKIKLVYWQK